MIIVYESKRWRNSVKNYMLLDAIASFIIHQSSTVWHGSWWLARGSWRRAPIFDTQDEASEHMDVGDRDAGSMRSDRRSSLPSGRPSSPAMLTVIAGRPRH